ncbi:Lrp/AsnC ligand binding domain-containing protein [Candidatus Bathyarchaeota archaeon]|nr:Lrp/AsnC ligand binding domain-containing protein [Candidatus Bathyarchaeota archaeon]
MEKALLLVVLGPRFIRETIDKIRKIPGVNSAHFLYGPYDMYIMIESENRGSLREIVVKIREVEGLRSTITCNILQQ